MLWKTRHGITYAMILKWGIAWWQQNLQWTTFVHNLQFLHHTSRIPRILNMKFGSIPGPRNWHPLALTAAHRFEESCWGFWCCRISSVTVRSPKDRAARMARILPSSSTSWQWTRVTSFLCIGRLRTLWVVLFRPTPLKESKKLFLGLQSTSDSRKTSDGLNDLRECK